MTIMELSKKTIRKIDIRDSRLKIGVLIIISEIFLGFICLILGLNVIPLVLGSILMLCVFFYPKIGLIIMLFLMPGVEYLKYDIGSVSITPFRILLIPVLLGTVSHIVVRRSPIKMFSIGPPIAALISVAVMSIIQSSYIGAGLVQLIFLLSLFSTTFVVAQLLDDKKWIQRAVYIMIASSVVLITLSLVEAYFGFKGLPPTITGGHRLFGKQIGALYAGPHLFNLDITTYLPFALVLAATAKRLKFIFFMLLVLAFIAGMLLSAALAGWLAALVSLTLLIIIGFAQKKYKGVIKVFKWLTLIILLASILVTFIIPTGLLEARFRRFATLMSVEGVYTSRTVEVRIPVWIAITEMFYEHPILGVGLGSIGYEYHEYMVARVGKIGKVFAHRGSFNVFVDRMAEMGILGIIAFLWLIIAYGRLLLKNLVLVEDPFLANMLLASSIASLAIFLQMQFESGHFWANNFWCLLGLSLAIINVSKAKGSETNQGKTIYET
jgi:O-antigen ligase